MLDEKEREQIALKKFALIAPILNGQISNQREYLNKLASSPLEISRFGLRRYTIKTFQWWMYLYRRYGLDGLKPGYRSDRGKSRRVSAAMADQIQAKRESAPGLNGILLYDELVKNGVFSPDQLSLATFYRFLARNPNVSPNSDVKTKDVKRFAHQWINELWQSDIMYGPYLKLGRIKKQTYLIAFIDDASRLITHAQFSYEQNFTAVRNVFKDAILRRGLPKLVYSDNGKVYRCNQMAVICAGMGCILLHAEPYSPSSKGKIERFFLTVRKRFLSLLEPDTITIDELNLRFWRWLEEDYQRKIHSSLGMSPLDFFMSQADRVRLFPNLTLLDECFLLRVTRKINHDATFSLETILYETDPQFVGTRMEIRFEPDWLNNPSRPVFLYREGTKTGEARQVDFHANARLKRRKRGRPVQQKDAPSIFVMENGINPPTVSFTELIDNKPEPIGGEK